MNYIELFANGGLTKSEKSEGEQRAMQLLESLQELTGVDPKQAAEILNQFKDDPETVNNIQEYVNLAIDPQSDENTRSNAISELTKIFNPSMFKCGGKLQQLVTKFGKGGPVDCGCGGIKLDMGGPVKDGEYTRSDFFNELNEWTPVKLPNGDSGYVRNYRKPLFRFGPSSNTLTQMLVTYDENGTPRASSREIKGFFNPNRVKLDTTYNTANNTPASKDFINRMNFALEGVAPERPQSKQEGGSIELTQLPGHDVNTTLTRRQARQLAMDKGRYVNNAQFQTAIANAMNTARSMGLHGAEARQRAMEMVAGVSPAERSINVPTASTFGNITPIKESDLRSQTPTQVSTQESISKPMTPTPEQSLDDLSFAQAFAQSRKSSAKTFNWRGKSYGTNLAKSNQNDTSNRQSSESVSRRENLGYPTPNTREPIRIETENGAYGYDNNGNYFESTNVTTPNTQTRRGNFWRNFVNATLNAQSGELPVSSAVMTASGFHQDRNGNWYQRQTDEDQQLGKDLALLGAAGVAGSTIAGLASGTGAGSTNLLRLNAAPRTPLLQPTSPAPYKIVLNNPTPINYWKQGGQIEKDITKTLKCGGKTKKK